MTNEQLAVDCLRAAKVLQDAGSFAMGSSILRDAAARIRELGAERDGLLRVVSDNHSALQRAEAALATAQKPVTFAETDKALQTVNHEAIDKCAWLSDPLFLARLLSTIIKDRRDEPAAIAAKEE